MYNLTNNNRMENTGTFGNRYNWMTGTIINNGTFDNSGRIYLYGTIDNTASGTLNLLDGSIIDIPRGSLTASGGTINLSGKVILQNGPFNVGAAAIFDTTQCSGLEIRSGATLDLSQTNSFSIDCPIEIMDGGSLKL